VVIPFFLLSVDYFLNIFPFFALRKLISKQKLLAAENENWFYRRNGKNVGISWFNLKKCWKIFSGKEAEGNQ
jgi:hypothetical protein